MAKEKAEELEEFQEPVGGMSGREEEPEAKRRRSDKQVGIISLKVPYSTHLHVYLSSWTPAVVLLLPSLVSLVPSECGLTWGGGL